MNMDWGHDKGLYKQATVFFFTNFPDNWSYLDIWWTFGKFSRVYAIYSPQRRSKNGRRFRFIRFLEEENARAIENQLDQIQIESHKIWVNLAKYPVEETESREIRRITNTNSVVHGKTYADAVRRQHEKNSWRSEDYPMEKRPTCVYKDDRRIKKLPRIYKKSFTWKVISHVDSELGGELVLIDCDDKGGTKRVSIGDYGLARPMLHKYLANMTNSLFSMRYDFMPNFNIDSDNEELWSDCNELEIQREEDDWDANLEPPAGEEGEEGENRELSQIDKRSIAIPQNEVEFEFEEEGCAVKGYKLVDNFPYSRLGEEESVEVVVNSFDMSLEASDLGGRIKVRLYENRPQKEMTTDPIESSAGNDLGLQDKRILEPRRQAHKGKRGEVKDNWIGEPKDYNKRTKNESRIEHKFEMQNLQ
ncbi:hypothetical protein SLEP1_g3532 [Rubroshorea leprosula]|uniref:RRM domain-containing protein n=1 Tax=Rubroshorea leprosula TaxID=152421 RepID=A0AAV5HRS9_9ROSI|nr:hypothetical protein SLEP1_g3532 [Rubroshorea leprosula]